MSDLISREALLSALKNERDEYAANHVPNGAIAGSDAVQEHLGMLDERIDFVEHFPAVEPIATLVNNNQPGWLNIIETEPNVTIHIGTKLYAGAA